MIKYTALGIVLEEEKLNDVNYVVGIKQKN